MTHNKAHKYKLLIHILWLSILSFILSSCQDDNEPITVSFIKPVTGTILQSGSIDTISCYVTGIIAYEYPEFFLYNKEGYYTKISNIPSTNEGNRHIYKYAVPTTTITDSSYFLIVKNSHTEEPLDTSGIFTIIGLPLDMYEPDDSVSIANQLILNEHQSHTLNKADEFDYYKLALEKDSTYQISWISEDTLIPEICYGSFDVSYEITIDSSGYSFICKSYENDTLCFSVEENDTYFVIGPSASREIEYTIKAITINSRLYNKGKQWNL